ncbi:hypothetical protein EV401DRAFT_2208803 [Pisolithus croceorrhizus]|nr:hypothetical protein EV401DRAFT_2208803 [Pisolithus croceorrhizus]
MSPSSDNGAVWQSQPFPIDDDTVTLECFHPSACYLNPSRAFTSSEPTDVGFGDGKARVLPTVLKRSLSRVIPEVISELKATHDEAVIPRSESRFGTTKGDRRGDEKLHHAKVSGLGNVEFTTADNLTLDKRKKFIFVYPCIRHIRGPSTSEITGENEAESDADTDSDSDGSVGLDEDASSHAVAMPQVGGYARALQTIVPLGQPFNVFLLMQQPNGEYKRVATENEIVVSGLGTDITPRNTWARVLEIL